MDFNGIMPDKDRRHLCSQLGYAYSATIRSPCPPHLHLLGLHGELKEVAHKQMSGARATCVQAVCSVRTIQGPAD